MPAFRPRRMKFGIFLAPFHRLGENPTLAMKRDLKLIEHLDDLGFDEAWIGEHHSYARELLADPAVFIAAAAQRTRRIRLGTGVISLPYHHPLMVADQMLMLDHLTEGRAMMGVGPGALVSDAYMMGIEPSTQRPRMNQALGAILRLLRGETVSEETDWYTLREARLQMASYSDPHLEVAVAATFTPTGPAAAGKHGVGLLSVAGAAGPGFENTWNWAEEAAADAGKTINRAGWRVVTPVHLAESRQEAIEDVREGFKLRAYVGDRKNPDGGQAGAIFGGRGTDIEAAIETGGSIVGTPDDAITAIESIVDRSGGIGGILGLAHEWAGWDKTKRSYELWARYVAPHFQSQLGPLTQSRDWVEEHQGQVFGPTVPAFAKAFEDAGKEVPEAVRKAQEAQAQ